MTQLWLDDETFSPEPITNGTHKYAEGVEILIRALALDDGPVLMFDLTPGGDVWQLAGDDLVLADPFDVADVEGALADDKVEVWAHNSHFDRTVERHAGLDIPLYRWRDTMIQAMAHSLPGKLETLCGVLGLASDKAKDKAGKALIQLFCKPVAFRYPKMPTTLAQRESKNKKEYSRERAKQKADYLAAREAAQKSWPGRATRESHPAEWRRFLAYAGQDINAMRACHKIMPKWNYPNRADELALWHQDQRINDRGVAIDVALAAAAVRAVDIAQAELRERTAEVTGGEVASATQRDAMLLHVLAEYGVDLPDMQMATLERRIADPDLPEGLRELLRIRLQASTTSTSKYRTLMRCVSSDARLRGLLQFCGANRTGRWAGRLWQPQNLPRPVLKQDEIDLGIQALMEDCAHLLFDNVMQLTSSAIRGCIVAPRGRSEQVAGWARYAGNAYEVSSKGDARFSALNATLADGRTIEQAYQLDVKGYRELGDSWRLGKGKPPLRKMSKDQLYAEYLALWARWADENPQLIEELLRRANGKTLTDMFATGHVSQARALYDVLQQRFGGRKLVVADLSNIEGRVLAWLAGETWKIKAFRDFDNGTGFDLYALAYAKSFNVSPQSVLDDKKAGGNQRQIGKVQELALGYEGGVGAFLTFAAAYGIDLEQLADQAFRAIPQHVMAQANIMFEWHRDKKKKDPAAAVGLSKKAWLVCESFKLAWREAHPNIRAFWKDLDETVRQAIDTPGHTFQCRMLKVRRDGKWLRIVLPSGRALCYPSPEIGSGGGTAPTVCPTCKGDKVVLVGGFAEDAPGVPAHNEVCGTCNGTGKIKGKKDKFEGQITYMGMNQYTRKWERLSTYGGKLAENVTQAVARDVMAANMPGVERQGYDIVLSVHDELITETEDNEGRSAAKLSAILAQVPDWAPGLPLAAAGFDAYRYKKD